jgi:hypothetical protein
MTNIVRPRKTSYKLLSARSSDGNPQNDRHVASYKTCLSIFLQVTINDCDCWQVTIIDEIMIILIVVINNYYNSTHNHNDETSMMTMISNTTTITIATIYSQRLWMNCKSSLITVYQK